MEEYTLQLPQEYVFMDGYKKKWFVGVEEDSFNYLRPSMEILNSTGYTEGLNVGYWDTYKEALEAKEKYESK